MSYDEATRVNWYIEWKCYEYKYNGKVYDPLLLMLASLPRHYAYKLGTTTTVGGLPFISLQHQSLFILLHKLGLRGRSRSYT
jgi:hypothetical protein